MKLSVKCSCGAEFEIKTFWGGGVGEFWASWITLHGDHALKCNDTSKREST
jgi:hypothetical protein